MVLNDIENSINANKAIKKNLLIKISHYRCPDLCTCTKMPHTVWSIFGWYCLRTLLRFLISASHIFCMEVRYVVVIIYTIRVYRCFLVSSRSTIQVAVTSYPHYWTWMCVRMYLLHRNIWFYESINFSYLIHASPIKKQY